MHCVTSMAISTADHSSCDTAMTELGSDLGHIHACTFVVCFLYTVKPKSKQHF